MSPAAGPRRITPPWPAATDLLTITTIIISDGPGRRTFATEWGEGRSLFMNHRPERLPDALRGNAAAEGMALRAGGEHAAAPITGLGPAAHPDIAASPPGHDPPPSANTACI